MLEQHPVPQNVTTFQFRLIGDMTIKQFGYLAGGAILAYISFNLPLPFFFRYPLTAIFALGGIGFAFVPIEERPMDVWFLSFIRSIYSPTQYLWQREAPAAPIPALQPSTGTSKKATAPSLSALFNFSFLTKPHSTPLPSVAATTPTQPKQPKPAPAKPAQNASWLGSLFAPTTPKQKPIVKPAPLPQVDTGRVWRASQGQPAVVPVPAVHPYPSVLASAPIPTIAGKHLDEAGSKPPQNTPPAQGIAPQPLKDDNRTGVMEQRLKEMEEQLKKEQNTNVHTTQLQEQLVSALSDKQRLEKELEEVKRHLSQQQKPQEVLRNAGETAARSPDQPTVNVFTPDAAKSAGIPTITTIPNVVSGIVRERTGNLLVGILVTVKDKEDVPVRALKTNKLGQFAASTPLAHGTYTLEIEDPKGQFFFDQARVLLNGSVLPPIEIIAKTQQELDRKKLEHAVFGQQNA